MDTAAELDLFQPSTLYWKAVPIFLRRSDKDERVQDLTIRIIAGFTRANHSQRVLRIYVSSEADLLFLYVLEVNEDDFAALKLDQGILVDFANFPGKIMGLLEKCIACKGEELPRFQAVLQTHGGQGTFKLVETNDFKQLPHITLLFRPGNDAAVKQFLAFRLTELSADCQQLSSELSKAQSDRNSLQTSLTETKRHLASTKEQHDKHVLEFEADVKTKEALLADVRARELNDLREQHLRERGEAERRYQEQLEGAQQRIGELDADNRALRQQKYELDTRVSELSHKMGAAEGSNRSLGEEVERLRVLTQQLSRDKAERDVEIGEALTKVAALEDKVDVQRAAAAEQADRIRGLEASLRQVEARAEELKAAAQGHEQRAKEATSEILKANAIIEKLSNDLRMGKEKMRRKAAIIARQEEEVQQRDQALDEARQQTRSLQRDLDRAKADASELQREVEELRRKLEDSKQQLQSNEQMIRWLNSQITESQLHYSGTTGLASSRYTFRPSVAAPSVLSGGGGGGGPAAGSTASLGAAGSLGVAAPSLSRGFGTYRSPAMPTSSVGTGIPASTGSMMGATPTSASIGAASNVAGVTPPTSRFGPGTTAIPSASAAPGTAGSGAGGYQGSSFYTGGSSAYSGHTRQSGGGGPNAAGFSSGGASGGGGGPLPAARSLNLGGLSLGESGSGGVTAAGQVKNAAATGAAVYRPAPSFQPQLPGMTSAQ